MELPEETPTTPLIFRYRSQTTDQHEGGCAFTLVECSLACWTSQPPSLLPYLVARRPLGKVLDCPPLTGNRQSLEELEPSGEDFELWREGV